MPQLGGTVTEGTISTWFKSIGDKVTAGENLFEIETDKAAMEVQAVESGVLTEIRGAVGETLHVGSIVAVIGGQDQPAVADTTPVAAAAYESHSRTEPAIRPDSVSSPADFSPFNEVRTPERGYGRAGPYAGLRSTPLARRLASQNNVDLMEVAQRVKARGGSRIAKADVLAVAQSARSHPDAVPAAAAPSLAPGARRLPLNKIRHRTAAHLTQSWQTIPHVLQAIEVDFYSVEKTRATLNAQFGDTWGFKLSYLPFIARAVCLAIRRYPFVNASISGPDLIVHPTVNLGVAVDLAHEGLVVPVVHRADDLNLIGLARALKTKAEQARNGALTPGDIAGGTYTISNSGSFGTLITAPIVNPPEVAILSTDGVSKKPVIVDTEDGEHIAIRPVGILAQSFDHRAFDGAYSASFLGDVRRVLETRDWRQEI